MVITTCNPSTQEVEAEGSWVQGQSGLHSETLSQKKKISIFLEFIVYVFVYIL
jgi:hypothetical protein